MQHSDMNIDIGYHRHIAHKHIIHPTHARENDSVHKYVIDSHCNTTKTNSTAAEMLIGHHMGMEGQTFRHTINITFVVSIQATYKASHGTDTTGLRRRN